MGIYTEAIQKLYVAYFNRPADFAGLAYWETVVTAAKGDTSAVSKAFAASDEYKKAYAGMDAYHVVAQVYQNLFGHQPDLAGLQFWGTKLQAGSLTIDSIVKNIADGAQGTDLTAYNSKVAAATAFSAALDTPAEALGYSGDIANGLAKAWLSNVKDEATLKAAIDATALASAVSGISNPPIPGQTYNLSQGLDTLVGTSANDVFNAFAFNSVSGNDTTTLQTVDSIDGGAGNDVLNIEVKANAAVAGTNFNPAIVGTIKNVETINIDNTSAAAAGLATIDASVFSGATKINQIAQAADITNVAAGTTAAFTGVTATVAADLGVTAASTATSAAIALDGVKGATATAAPEVQNRAYIEVDGAKLASVSVTGTLAKANTATGTSTASLGLNVTLGKDVQSATVTSAVRTTLAIENAAGSTKDLISVDASASTGNITYTSGDAQVRTVKTGAGNDTVTVITGTAVDNSTTTDTDETVSATVSTGAGIDTINVNTTGVGLTSVDAGEGNDKVVVSTLSQNVTVNGGAGDDYIVFNRGVGAKDVVNGGDGTDYLGIKGSSLIAQDYEILRAVVSGVEALEFQDAITGVDASKLTQFTEFDVDMDGSSIVKIADAQSIVTYGDVTLTNAGYAVGSSLTTATYAGTLNVYAEGGLVADHLVVAASAKDVVLDVAATAATSTAAGVASFVELAGDAKTATVNLTNSVNAATGSTATADVLASFFLTTNTTNAAGAYTADRMLTTVTLTGNGYAEIVNGAATTKLTTVDASGMTGVAAYDATKQVGGLKFTAQDAIAETVKLGGGKDLVITNSTYQNMDTITGLKLVGDTNGSLVLAKSDALTVGAGGFAKTTVTGATFGLALTDAAAKAGNSLVFQFNGDTYVFIDNANTAIDASNTVGTFGADDVVVKLTGAIDLDLLLQALNGGGV